MYIYIQVGSIGKNFWKNIKIEKLKDDYKFIDYNSTKKHEDTTKKHEISTKLEEIFDDDYYDNLESEEKILREQEKVCIYTNIIMSLYIYDYECVCIYSYTKSIHIYVYIYVCIHIYICIYVCIYIHIYTYVYICM
jgi:hypothetical protein